MGNRAWSAPASLHEGARDVRAWIADEAERWLLSPGLAEAAFLLPIVGAVVVALTRVDKSLFRFITREDGLLEWAQFAGFVLALAFALLVGISLLSEGARTHGALYLLIALGCLVVAGEEISWGQRIVGFGTPEVLEDINKQEEVTVHNIKGIQEANSAILMLIGLYGCAATVVMRLRGRPATPVSDLFVPPVFLAAAFFVLFAFKFGRHTFIPQNTTIVEYGEWPELCFAFGLAAFTYLVWRRRRLQSGSVRPGGERRGPADRAVAG